MPNYIVIIQIQKDGAVFSQPDPTSNNNYSLNESTPYRKVVENSGVLQTMFESISYLKRFHLTRCYTIAKNFKVDSN